MRYHTHLTTPSADSRSNEYCNEEIEEKVTVKLIQSLLTFLAAAVGTAIFDYWVRKISIFMEQLGLEEER